MKCSEKDHKDLSLLHLSSLQYPHSAADITYTPSHFIPAVDLVVREQFLQQAMPQSPPEVSSPVF